MAPGNAVPSDLGNHSCSMSVVLAGLAVFLVAFVLGLGERPDIQDVGYERCQAAGTVVGLVPAMVMAGNTED